MHAMTGQGSCAVLGCCAGGEDGAVRLFDLRDGREVAAFHAADDTVNGCHFHPYLPLLGTASGG